MKITSKTFQRVIIKKKIKQLLKKVAFKEYMQEKNNKSKMNLSKYEHLNIQYYLTEPRLSRK